MTLREELDRNKTNTNEIKEYKERTCFLQDEIGVLKHKQKKCVETQERLRIYEMKIEEMERTKEASLNERKGQSDTNVKNFKVEKELHVFQSFHRQLETYETRENSDDSETLVKKYREEFLATKAKLKGVQEILKQSKRQEENFQTEITNLQNRL